MLNASTAGLELFGDSDPFAVFYTDVPPLDSADRIADAPPSLDTAAAIDAASIQLRSAAKSDLLTAASALWREEYAFGVRTILAAADRTPRLLALGLSDMLSERERQDLRLALLRVENPPRQLVHERDAAFAAGILHAALNNREEAARWLTIAERLGETSPTLQILRGELGARTQAMPVLQARR
ncbi:MAG: hypothetical protein KF768_03545 [Phycisphaeraceae bacterium]|nr:hypothetical protein [Phycisphaeraceae bacterium]